MAFWTSDRSCLCRLAALAVLCSAPAVWAADPFVRGPAEASAAPTAAAVGSALDQELGAWLLRSQEASRKKTYTGTFVVLSSTGAMMSSRIWHSCENDQQVERVDALSGAPKSVFRRNNQVVTFLPQTQVVKTERRDAYGLFPHLTGVGASSLARYYGARRLGSERVAGFDTDVVQIDSRDAMRYGYRLWTEKKSGFAVRLQTLDIDGRVIEQAAFSELDFNALVRSDQLVQMMNNTTGFRVESQDAVKTSAEDEGWSVKQLATGFQPVACYRRVSAHPASQPTGSGAPAPSPATPPAPVWAPTPGGSGVGGGGGSGGVVAVSTLPTVQCIFSDGLATVSLFLEPYGSASRSEWHMSNGVTQMMARRVPADGWVTAVGEVPAATLRTFTTALERRR